MKGGKDRGQDSDESMFYPNLSVEIWNRNWSVLYHKTKNPFEAKTFMNISF